MQRQDLQEVLYLAATHHQAGQLDEAEKLYKKVLQEQSTNPEANHNLGIIAMQTGKGAAIALPLFERGWQADPAHQQHWQSYVRALVENGDNAAASAVYADGKKRGLTGPAPELLQSRQQAPPRTAQNTPHDTPDLQAAYTKIIKRIDQGDIIGAEQAAQGLINSSPQNRLSWKALGLVARARHRDTDAISALGNAISLTQRATVVDTELLSIQGQLLYQNGMYNEAIVILHHLLAAQPDNQDAVALMARAMLQGHRVAEAQAICSKALQEWPGSADFHLILAQAQAENGETDEAVASYRSALELENDLAEAYRGLGAILFARQHYAEVIALCSEMIRARPDYHAAHADLGTALQACGRMGEAMVAYEQAIVLNPQNLDARSNWLFCSNYTDGKAPQVIYEHAVAFSQYASAHASPFDQWRCANTPTRLRVGLVSGDLREHPVGYFLENVIANTDVARVEWLAYSTVAQSDELTARLQTHVTKWTMLAGMSYEDSARCIHADGVHILIDLSGHTDKNILPVFAWRPAPIQVSWLGYFATTGLAEMDYFVADPVSVPVTEQRYFREKIWSIADTRLCFSPPENAPDVATSPSLANGYVTFGSFQKIPKITDVTLSLWAQILSICPTACLRIQSGGLEDEVTRQALVERARLAGIEVGRLQLHQSESRSRYLAAHSEVDILLDTFPFTGGTTTCEALWMGVPTVTLAGKNLVSRQGASLLGAAGLSDWVTESSQQYVDIAVQKAIDTEALRSLREGLRRQVQASPLYNAKLFSERFAEALWGMWNSRG